MGIPGGSAAMRRPKWVPLPRFPDRNWSVPCLPLPALTISAAAALVRALPRSPDGAGRSLKRIAERHQEPPRRHAPGRARRPHAGRHRAQPQRSARRLCRIAVARSERRAGAARRRAAPQQAADAIFRAACSVGDCSRRARCAAIRRPTGRPARWCERVCCFGRSSHRPNVRSGGLPSRPPDAAPAAPRRAHSFWSVRCSPTTRLETPASLTMRRAGRFERRGFDAVLARRVMRAGACALAACRPTRNEDSTGRAATMRASWCRPAIRRCARRAAIATRAAAPGPSPIPARPRSAAAPARHAG